MIDTLTIYDVKNITGFSARFINIIYEMGIFPKPFKDGSKKLWLKNEVQSWILDKENTFIALVANQLIEIQSLKLEIKQLVELLNTTNMLVLEKEKYRKFLENNGRYADLYALNRKYHQQVCDLTKQNKNLKNSLYDARLKVAEIEVFPVKSD